MTTPCDPHQEKIPDALAGRLSAAAQAELEAHCAACADCRALYESFEHTAAVLERAFPSDGEARPKVWRRIERSLVQSGRMPAAPKIIPTYVPLFAAAAMVALALLLFLASARVYVQPRVAEAKSSTPTRVADTASPPRQRGGAGGGVGVAQTTDSQPHSSSSVLKVRVTDPTIVLAQLPAAEKPVAVAQLPVQEPTRAPDAAITGEFANREIGVPARSPREVIDDSRGLALLRRTGPVAVFDAAHQAWRDVVAGESVPYGARVRTAAGALAELAFGESRVRVDAQSEVSVAYEAGPESSEHKPARVAELTRGRIRVDLLRSERRFLIHSNGGTVELTGTVVDVDAPAADVAFVRVLEGHVKVTPAAQQAPESLAVAAGEEGLVANRLNDGLVRGLSEKIQARVRELIATGLHRRDADATNWPASLDKPPATLGSLVVKDEHGADAGPLSIESLDVKTQIRGPESITRVDQRFYNSTNSVLEGVYTFPVPPGAAISRFAMYVDDKTLIEGEVVERGRARAIYESILHAKRDPALLEWVDGNTFKARVFPIPARSAKRVILEYTQLLPAFYDARRYVFPLVSELTQKSGIGKLNIEVDLATGDASKFTEIASPSYAKQTQVDGAESSLARATFSATDIRPNADFVLNFSAPRASELYTAAYAENGEQPYLLLGYQPKLAAIAPKKEAAAGRDVLFIAETSGARTPQEMSGERQAIAAMLAALNDNDRVTLAAADVGLERLNAEWLPAHAEGVTAALTALRNRAPLGALDLSACIRDAGARAIGSPPPGEAGQPRQRLVIFIGAGVPALGTLDSGQLAKDGAAELKSAKAAFIALSLGRSVDALSLSELARRSNGYYLPLKLDECLDATAFQLGLNLQTPLLQAPSFTAPAGTLAEIYPANLGALLPGQEIFLNTRVQSGANFTLKLSAQLSGQPYERSYEIALPADLSADPAVGRFWARARLDHLLAQPPSGSGESGDAGREEVIALAKAWTLMSPYTSFLVLESDADYKRYDIDRSKRRAAWRDLDVSQISNPNGGIQNGVIVNDDMYFYFPEISQPLPGYLNIPLTIVPPDDASNPQDNDDVSKAIDLSDPTAIAAVPDQGRVYVKYRTPRDWAQRIQSAGRLSLEPIPDNRSQTAVNTASREVAYGLMNPDRTPVLANTTTVAPHLHWKARYLDASAGSIYDDNGMYNFRGITEPMGANYAQNSQPLNGKSYPGPIRGINKDDAWRITRAGRKYQEIISDEIKEGSEQKTASPRMLGKRDRYLPAESTIDGTLYSRGIVMDSQHEPLPPGQSAPGAPFGGRSTPIDSSRFADISYWGNFNEFKLAPLSTNQSAQNGQTNTPQYADLHLDYPALSDQKFVSGDIIVKGYYTGPGDMWATGNIYRPDDTQYTSDPQSTRGPIYPANPADTQGLDGFIAGKTIIVGDYLTASLADHGATEAKADQSGSKDVVNFTIAPESPSQTFDPVTLAAWSNVLESPAKAQAPDPATPSWPAKLHGAHDATQAARPKIDNNFPNAQGANGSVVTDPSTGWVATDPSMIYSIYSASGADEKAISLEKPRSRDRLNIKGAVIAPDLGLLFTGRTDPSAVVRRRIDENSIPDGAETIEGDAGRKEVAIASKDDTIRMQEALIAQERADSQQIAEQNKILANQNTSLVHKNARISKENELRIYDLAGLINTHSDFPGPQLNPGTPGTSKSPDEPSRPSVDDIKQRLIDKGIAPNSVEENAGKLIVIADPKEHAKIDEALKKIRDEWLKEPSASVKRFRIRHSGVSEFQPPAGDQSQSAPVNLTREQIAGMLAALPKTADMADARLELYRKLASLSAGIDVFQALADGIAEFGEGPRGELLARDFLAASDRLSKPELLDQLLTLVTDSGLRAHLLAHRAQYETNAAKRCELLGKAFEESGDDVAYLQPYAAALNLAGRGKEVIAKLEAALREGNAQAWMWPMLAQAYRAAGDERAAFRALTQSVALQPREAQPRIELAFALDALRDGAGALREARAACEFSPENAEYHRTLLSYAKKYRDNTAREWVLLAMLRNDWQGQSAVIWANAREELEALKGEYRKAENAAKAEALTKLQRAAEATDIVAVLSWNTDKTDIDLHVDEPGNQQISYNSRTSFRGGNLDRDVTTGFGPETYTLRHAPAGKFKIWVHYYAGSVPTDATVKLTRNSGTEDETTETFHIHLERAHDQATAKEFEIK